MLKSFKAKFILYISPWILLLALGYLTLFLTQSYGTIKQELIKRGYSLVQGLSYSSQYSVSTEDQTYIDIVLKNLINEQEVMFMVVYNEEGKIISATSKKDVIYKEEIKNLIAGDMEIKTKEDSQTARKPTMVTGQFKNNETYFEFVCPVFAPTGKGSDFSQNEIIGFARIGFSTQNLNKQVANILYMGLIVLLITIVISSIVIMTLAKSLTNPINQLVNNAKLISSGDLSKPIEINSKDELGLLATVMDQMRKDLNSIVGHIRNVSKRVSLSTEELSTIAEETDAGIKQISSAMNTVAEGTTKQVESIKDIISEMAYMMDIIVKVSSGAENQFMQLQKTTEIVNQNDYTMSELASMSKQQSREVDNTKLTISQMANTIDQVTSEAGNVAANSLKTADVAKKSENIVLNTVEGMNKIKSTVLNAGDKIEELGHNSSQIGEIIEVINDIAEQTNLLALNAAIEAARAGDHGRGFAVVADEVRKLAERSSKATKEIAGLIKKIQVGTDNAVDSMKIGTAEVQKGSELIMQTRDALKNILEAVSGTVSQIQNISAAAEEMSASSNQSVETMNGIATNVSNNAKLFDELIMGFKEVVASINNVQTVAKENQKAAEGMKEKYEKASEKINYISVISSDNSTVAEEVTASTEQMNGAIEQFNVKTQDLIKTVSELSSLVEKFIL